MSRRDLGEMIGGLGAILFTAGIAIAGLFFFSMAVILVFQIEGDWRIGMRLLELGFGIPILLIFIGGFLSLHR